LRIFWHVCDTFASTPLVSALSSGPNRLAYHTAASLLSTSAGTLGRSALANHASTHCRYRAVAAVRSSGVIDCTHRSREKVTNGGRNITGSSERWLRPPRVSVRHPTIGTDRFRWNRE